MLTEESDYKWKLMYNILNDIYNIKSIIRVQALREISLIIADKWKLVLYNSLMSLLEETKNHGEIMKKLMVNSELKKNSQQINKIVSRVLKNVGKYPKFTLSPNEERNFFDEIKHIIEKKYNCKVNALFEKDSKERKASQALPGKPAIIIS